MPNSHCQFVSRKRAAPFFEGWYLRLVFPDGRTFVFIFALEALNKGTIQVIDDTDTLRVFELPPSAIFHGNEDGLPWSFSHWGGIELLQKDAVSYDGRQDIRCMDTQQLCTVVMGEYSAKKKRI